MKPKLPSEMTVGLVVALAAAGAAIWMDSASAKRAYAAAPAQEGRAWTVEVRARAVEAALRRQAAGERAERERRSAEEAPGIGGSGR